MKFTSIAITKDLKEELDKSKVHYKESYMGIIKRLINSGTNLVILAAGTGTRFKSKTKDRTDYYYVPTELIFEISDYLDKIEEEQKIKS